MRREPGGGALHTGGGEIAANSPDIIAPTEMLQTRKSAISETPHPTPQQYLHYNRWPIMDLIQKKAWFLSSDVEKESYKFYFKWD